MVYIDPDSLPYGGVPCRPTPQDNNPPNATDTNHGSKDASSTGTPDIVTWIQSSPLPMGPVRHFQSPIGRDPSTAYLPQQGPIAPPHQRGPLHLRRPPLGSPPRFGIRTPALPPQPYPPRSPYVSLPAHPASPAPAPAPAPAASAISPFGPPAAVAAAAAAAHEPRLHDLLRLSLLVAGTSPNYRGNPYLPANQSADIPDSENTALWLTNLPPDCDHRTLLGAVRGCGKVWATVVNPPVHAQNHITAACKLVFFDVAGAQALLRQSREGLFAVGGYVPRVRHNRIRSGARPLGPQSRVLHIEGPERVVDVRRLAAFFAARFTFELEGVVVLERSGPRARHEWRFGSYRCQAESARVSIAKEKERLGAMMGAAGGYGGGGAAAATGAAGGAGGNGFAGRQQYPDQKQQHQEHVDLEERLAWQSVTVHFAVDPCSVP
ncbi:hypothetical protein F5X99DRAFT_427919 [Biscogniauxia marginata]|nr:hypothetical protein F5X99DRAFT_427919 [Biscogniauxia marginata]